jgi:hypothetical protein
MKKITTSFETVYIKRKDGFFQEIINHYLHFVDETGKKITKLDKQIPGILFKEARDGERSSYGEAFVTTSDNRQVRIIGIGENRKW